MNTFGNILRLTTAGESHGPAMTAILDGLPAGVKIDPEAINAEVARRRTGATPHSSTRNETDAVEILSGVFEGVSTGAPIALMVRNHDQRPADYDHLRDVFRPSHADYTYQMKYGLRDYRGGGRSSARETVLRVAAGAIALQALEGMGIDVLAYSLRIGGVGIQQKDFPKTMDEIYANPMRCPSETVDRQMERLVGHVRSAGDTVGGIIGGIIYGLPAGLGEPVYGKFHAMLASAMMSINAAKGFDYGMGFDGCCRLGSEMNDRFAAMPGGGFTTLSNHSGGVQGGITNGNPVFFRVAFKPVATLMRDQPGIDRAGKPVIIPAHGRHDACVIPRAVPVVRAMAALTALDAILLARSSRL